MRLKQQSDISVIFFFLTTSGLFLNEVQTPDSRKETARFWLEPWESRHSVRLSSVFTQNFQKVTTLLWCARGKPSPCGHNLQLHPSEFNRSPAVDVCIFQGDYQQYCGCDSQYMVHFIGQKKQYLNIWNEEMNWWKLIASSYASLETEWACWEKDKTVGKYAVGSQYHHIICIDWKFFSFFYDSMRQQRKKKLLAGLMFTAPS